MSDSHTFVCYAREDADFVRVMVADLRERGLPIWLDADIVPAADWDRTIDERLRACARFLIVLSPPAVASTEVRGELRVALTLGKPIVPLLYEPCDIPRQLQNLQYLDFTTAADRADYSRVAAALWSLPLAEATATQRGARAGRALRNRRDYLDDLRSEVGGRLAQAFRKGALNVAKEQRPDRVVRAWDADVRVADHPRTLLSRETTIMDVFDDSTVSGRLLILGAPGSGKTTALLELAQALVARAENDDAAPMPALFNLSSWRGDEASLGAWIVDQLKVKYGVRKDNGREWLSDRIIVPLLDGLDEVRPEYQERCVEAINRFQNDYRPPQLVVCCRAAEYENYRGKLKLDGAIHLLPLADDQIRDYLVAAGSEALWEGIGADPASMDLARSPLLLRIMTIAYAETSPDEWRRLASASERQSHLFDVYVRRRLSDEPSPPYGNEQTLRWLSWLARATKAQGQAEFLLEQMQPRWLPSATHQWLYRGGVGVLCAIVVAAATYLVEPLKALVPDGPVGRQFQSTVERVAGDFVLTHAMFVAILATASGIVVASRSRIQPVETLVWSWERSWHGMTDGLRRAARLWLNRVAFIGLLAGLLAGLAMVPGALRANTSAPNLKAWTTAGGIAAALSLLTMALLALLTLRPATWLMGEPGTRTRPISIDAIVSGLVMAVAAAASMGPLVGAASGACLVAIHGLRGASASLAPAVFARTLVIASIGGPVIAAITWWVMKLRIALLDWVTIWLIGGAGVGICVASFIGIGSRFPTALVGSLSATAERLAAWSWRQSLVAGGILALILGTAFGAIGYSKGIVVRGASLMTSTIGLIWAGALAYSLLTLAVGASFGLVMGGFVGALFGVLGGLSGPDVERRTRPNQGIWQSARNIGVFAALGGLMVGLPYGLVNLATAVAATRTAPNVNDWIRLAVFPAFSFAVLGGLVPGAACIQHAVLRCVLALSGLAPGRYVRFLDYATDRVFLQRIGGRYRFIHDLLRDHLARMELGAKTRGVVPPATQHAPATT
jgi:TIR domain